MRDAVFELEAARLGHREARTNHSYTHACICGWWTAVSENLTIYPTSDQWYRTWVEHVLDVVAGTDAESPEG